MLIRDKGAFLKGILLAVTFFIVLFIMFLPLFDGKNTLKAADRLFNSISKDSSRYIPSLQKRNEAFMGTNIEATLKLKDADQTQQAIKLLTPGGVTTTPDAASLKVSGDLGKLLAAALADSDALYYNRSADLKAKHGFEAREVGFVWWNILKELDKDLKRQGKFKEATFIGDVNKRAVEVAFNFYQIEPKSARDNALILAASLIFYVIYTLWWGIAILMLFEGLGLEMKAGHKKEV